MIIAVCKLSLPNSTLKQGFILSSAILAARSYALDLSGKNIGSILELSSGNNLISDVPVDAWRELIAADLQGDPHITVTWTWDTVRWVKGDKA